MNQHKIVSRIQQALARNPNLLIVWSGTFGFLSYFCMYMMRKPFTAATYADQYFLEVDYKVWLIFAQVLGYSLSKFIGIQLISGLKPTHRIRLFSSLMVFAFLSLLTFYIIPAPYNIVCLFFNGLPLGLIWGIVFSYLEGRKITEILTIVLSVNFIISSGFAKSLGSYLIQMGVPAEGMPALCALPFLPLSILCILLLSMTPQPTIDDKRLRQARQTMDSKSRNEVFQKHGLAIAFFTSIYICLTILRDIRDNFAVEIWQSLGYRGDYSIFSLSELPIAVTLLIFLGMISRIQKNDIALKTIYLIILISLTVIFTSTMAFSQAVLHPMIWMMMSGAGLFIPYILFNGILFDRYIGAFRINGNTGFLMYIADAFGYLASVAVMVIKNFQPIEQDWLNYYIELSKSISIVLIVLVVFSFLYVSYRLKHREKELEVLKY